MAGIWFRYGEFTNYASEIVGYKAGLALSKDNLSAYMQEVYPSSNIDEIFRLRSEELEAIISNILYRVGHYSDPDPLNPLMKLSLRWGHPKSKDKYSKEGKDILNHFILKDYPKQIELIQQGKQEKTINPLPILEYAIRKYGQVGKELAILIMENYNESLNRSLLNELRRTEWKDTVELRELFETQNLETLHGTFFDQRFIDYLARNNHHVGKINWRKFEGLTCEFFEKSGFRVEIGPGSNDDGVDARVWPKQQDKNLPPAIIIQCKRQKEAIEKIQVKALYADILQEKAESGLIVTTSVLSPGAKKTCVARDYPIYAVDGTKVKQWISLLRTPGTGPFSIESDES